LPAIFRSAWLIRRACAPTARPPHTSSWKFDLVPHALTLSHQTM
jgi:hypothetical protein